MRGLAWATHEINPKVALLQSTGEDSYVIYEYALDLISAQNMPIPDTNWVAITANADTSELVRLGHIAEIDHHRVDIAAQAWRKVANSGHGELPTAAVVSLGRLLAAQGDAAGAKEAYQKAIDSPYATIGALAALMLGRLLAAQGDAAGAREAYQKAIDSRQSYETPMATCALGDLLADQGDIPGAKEAYQKVIKSGPRYAACLAALRLGTLLRDQGDVLRAKEAYRKFLELGPNEGEGGFFLDAFPELRRILDEHRGGHPTPPV
jgi:tetratricopeptide (TPR) repeat protein